MKSYNLIRNYFIAILWVSLIPILAQQPTNTILKPVQAIDFQQSIRNPHPVALKAIKKGEKPAAFTGVKIKLRPDIKILSPQKSVLIQKHLVNGVLLPSATQQIKIAPNQYYLDPKSGVVFRTLSLGKDTLVLQKPPLQMVLKEFKIPAQKVRFNLANTTYVYKGAKVNDSKTSSGNYLLKMEFTDSLYTFKKKVKHDHGETNMELTLKLSGHLYIENPEIYARYTSRHGYSFIINLHENADIKAELNGSITTEVEVPLWAFDIPAGDYGSCKIGIYAFVNIDGKVHLSYKIQQDVQMKAGLKGKTFAYYPRSYKPVLEFYKSFTTDYDVKAQLKVYGGIEVVSKIKVLKHNLVKVTTKAGPELETKLVDNNKYFEAKAGARFQIKAKLIKIKKHFTLLDKYYLLWEYKKKNYGGYIMTINDVDAYNDRLWGTILKEDDKSPYQGPLKVSVSNHGHVKQTYAATTNEQGIFALENVPLVKGDVVQIKMPNVPNPSEPVAASLPFKEIHLYYADYFTNTLQGSITSKINWFPAKQSEKQATVAISSGINQKLQNYNLNKVSQKSQKLDIKIDQNLFKNSIVYKGDIKVIARPGHKVKLNKINFKNPNNNFKNKHSKDYRQASAVISDAFKVKKKVINLPFGVFMVKNVNIKPYDQVKVQLNIDGFIVESNEVSADGLLISPSVDVNKEGNLNTPQIKADDSYTIVNALRSDITPTGTIRMLKGIDMKHTEPHKELPSQKIEFPNLKVFPQAKRPLIFYDVKTHLIPGVQKGFAEGHTGPWHIKNIFYDRKNLFKIPGIDGHRFEYINYEFDHMPVIYKYYQKTCSLDRNPRLNISKPKNRPIDLGKYKYLGY